MTTETKITFNLKTAFNLQSTESVETYVKQSSPEGSNVPRVNIP